MVRRVLRLWCCVLLIGPLCGGRAAAEQERVVPRFPTSLYADNSPITHFRRELLEAYHGYRWRYGRVRPTQGARYWSLAGLRRVSASFPECFGSEFRYLDPEHARSGNVIEIAAAADIRRTMLDFPLARHFHVADPVWGVAHTRFNPVLEWTCRVANLGRDCRVEIVDPGFLPFYKQTMGWRARGPIDAAEEAFDRGMRQDAQKRRPLVLRARFKSEALGSQDKLFYYHPIDALSSKEVREILATIPQGERLVGLQLHGWGLAEGVTESALAPALFDRLAPGGSYITSDSGEGNATTAFLAPRFFGKRLSDDPAAPFFRGIKLQQLPGEDFTELDTMLYLKREAPAKPRR
jgi:hypothetical protein